MANFVYIAASLDGYIADKSGDLDWLLEYPNPSDSDYGWDEFIAGIDAIVMGRGTFEKVLSFGEWPYERPVIVLSDTLKSVPEAFAEHVTLMQGEPAQIVKQIHAMGYKNLYIDGGRTVQRFLQADQVDELIITHVPVLLGDGYPLFKPMADKLRFEHLNTLVYNDTFVKSFYRRLRG